MINIIFKELDWLIDIYLYTIQGYLCIGLAYALCAGMFSFPVNKPFMAGYIGIYNQLTFGVVKSLTNKLLKYINEHD